ncbi:MULTISPECIES: hypothetical protein [unclassified Acinetobacter]|uniref:hypothetical protein n=1 Tax=unclassified Acinetobacter TaxID=196816 RepID=UPI00125040A2|nr:MULTISPECIES: hypothetical protein [unclassified Acinetobacter]
MCNGGAIASGFEAAGNISNALMADATAKGNAKTTKSVAKVQSKKILEQGRKDASTARAIAAENGLDINVGSPTLIEDEIIGDSAYNAAMNQSQAGYAAADMLRQGKMQRNNYGFKAASNVIDTAAKSYGGWK